MSRSPSARDRRGYGAQRPAQSAPTGGSEPIGKDNAFMPHIAVQGQKAQLHPRSATRSRVQLRQPGQPYYAAEPGQPTGYYHRAANIFNTANQEQLLAAYVAMMQSPNGTPHAAPQQQQYLQPVFSGHGGIPLLHSGAIDWNGVLSRQGSGAATNRMADLAGLLPQPRFQLARPDGSAPDTPQSLLAAASLQQQFSTPGSAAVAAAMHAMSYAYQQHFSSYWAAQAAGAGGGMSPMPSDGAGGLQPVLMAPPAATGFVPLVPVAPYAATNAGFMPGQQQQQQQLRQTTSVGSTNSSHVSSRLKPAGSSSSGSSRLARVKTHELVTVSSNSSNSSGGSSGSSTTYHSCSSSGSTTRTPFATAHAAAAAAAEGSPPGAEQQQWQQQHQQWSGGVIPPWPMMMVPIPVGQQWQQQQLQWQQDQGQWSPIYEQQYIFYMQHMQLLHQHEQQLQQQGGMRPGLHSTGSYPSAARSGQQQQPNHSSNGRSSVSSCPGSTSSSNGRQASRSHSGSSRTGSSSGTAAAAAAAGRNRRPSRLAAMTYASFRKPGSFRKVERPMSAVAEGEGTLVTTVQSDPVPVCSGPGAAAGAGLTRHSTAGLVVEEQSAYHGSRKGPRSSSSGGGCRGSSQPGRLAGSSSSADSRAGFFLSHSGSGTADAASEVAAAVGVAPGAASTVAAANAAARAQTRQPGRRDHSHGGGAAGSTAGWQRNNSSSGRRRWIKPQGPVPGRNGWQQQQLHWQQHQQFWSGSPRQQQYGWQQCHVSAGEYVNQRHGHISGTGSHSSNQRDVLANQYSAGSPHSTPSYRMLDNAQRGNMYMNNSSQQSGVHSAAPNSNNSCNSGSPRAVLGWGCQYSSNGRSGTPSRIAQHPFGQNVHHRQQYNDNSHSSRSLMGNGRGSIDGMKRNSSSGGGYHGNAGSSVRVASCHSSNAAAQAGNASAGRSGSAMGGSNARGAGLNANRQRVSWGGGFRRPNALRNHHQRQGQRSGTSAAGSGAACRNQMAHSANGGCNSSTAGNAAAAPGHQVAGRNHGEVARQDSGLSKVSCRNGASHRNGSCGSADGDQQRLVLPAIRTGRVRARPQAGSILADLAPVRLPAIVGDADRQQDLNKLGPAGSTAGANTGPERVGLGRQMSRSRSAKQLSQPAWK